MTEREKQLTEALAEFYGAALELGLITPPAKMTPELQTFVRTVSDKAKALGITPWKVTYPA